MFADTLKKLEHQYEIKRNQADAIFMREKKAIYDSTPELAKIDKEITLRGIKSAKLSVFQNNKDEIKRIQDEILDLKNKKEQLLRSLNITLEPKYTCTKCNDTGYIVKNGFSEMCSCMKQELINESYNSSNMNSLQNDNFENLDLTLYSDIPDIKYKSNISPRENIKKIIDISKEFINNFESADTKNLLFTGTTGVGKTFISSCIANEIIKMGYNVLYQTSPVLLDNIFEYKYNNKSSRELYSNLFSVNLLVIDDLGTENLTAAKFTEIFTILNTRLLKPNTKTIISTNFSLDELSKMYDTRILSRLIGNYSICRFFGEDIRLKH